MIVCRGAGPAGFLAGWSGGRRNPGMIRAESRQGVMNDKLKSKQEWRAETDRLIKEALERKSVTIQKVDGRREEKCGKCGAPNRVKIPIGQIRVDYTCKECGHEQRTM
jgi:DNA-directed RNA polymerase subunit M/transcription elongation factor TFIIS